MKNINTNKRLINKPLSGLFIFLAAVLLIISGCMETSTPENRETHEITVRTFLRTDNNPELTPIEGVLVDVEGADENAIGSGQGTTNNLGLANFDITSPLIGANYNITANYNGETQYKSNLLICRDTLLVFVFDNSTVNNIDCSMINGSDSLIFYDDLGSRLISQNSPPGVNRYERCRTISNSLSNPETITAQIPAATSPFELVSVILDGTNVPLNTNDIQIEPGSSITFCFSVSTEEAGRFNETVQIPLTCGGSQGNFSLYLDAEIVAPQCDCEELPDSYTFVMPESVEVGESAEHIETVLTNTLPCAVTIGFSNIDNGDEWEILSPDFPLRLEEGESIELSVRFTPTTAEQSTAVVTYLIQPEGSNQSCEFEVYLEGQGCSNACPLFSTNDLFYETFGSERTVDTLSNRNDNRVFASVSDWNESVATRNYYVMNPDTACGDVVINIIASGADSYADEYYEVSPRSLTLAPGQKGTFTVVFTAPEVAEFRDIIAERGATGSIMDSLFKVNIRLTTRGCSQSLEANAVVTSFPDISPIINLRAYNQSTPQKPDPENEVYTFGDDARTINKGTDGSPGEYPPLNGQIYIDVDDNTATANPPQEPILTSVNNNVEMKLWRRAYAESDFTNVPQLVTQFLTDPNYETGYSTNPIRNIQIGDVYAIRSGGFIYALLYIRRVDNGTENTSSKQSGIEFRAVYPIYAF